MSFHGFCKADVEGGFVYWSRQALVWELMRQFAFVTDDWDIRFHDGQVTIRPEEFKMFLDELFRAVGEEGLRLQRSDFETALAGNCDVMFQMTEDEKAAPDAVIHPMHKPRKTTE